jgi:hypothetical protein
MQQSESHNKGAYMFLINQIKRAALFCAAFLIIGQQGCASKPVKAPLLAYTGLSGERIGVIIQKDPGKPALKTPGKGVATSIGRGASAGALVGGGVGTYCGFGAIVCVPVGIALGTVGGAVYGGVASEKGSTWDEAESIFRANLTELNFDHLLAERLVTFTQENGYALHVLKEPATGDVTPIDCGRLSREGVSLVLELSEIVIELRPADLLVEPVNPPRRLLTSVRSRIIRTVDGVVLDDRITIDDKTDFHTLEVWMLSNGLKFRTQVSLAAQRMAETIVTELFFLQPLPERPLNYGITSLVFLDYITGLEPVHPLMDSIKLLGFVNSLQPTLSWKPFKGSDVTYDLKIWRSQDGNNHTELIYSREGLIEADHALETPLQPDTCYLWTVRARYKMAGQTRFTEWATFTRKPSPIFGVLSFGLAYILPFPDLKHHRFLTP